MPIPVDIAKEHLRDALRYIDERYIAGVEHAEWKKFALKANKTYKEAMELVIRDDLWLKGIEKSDDSKWKEGCKDNADKLKRNLEKALDIWEANFRPKYEHVLRIRETLPPSTLDWETNVDNRCKPIVAAWKGQTYRKRG